MKDSGVEWIGEIPKDWPINRVKYVCTEVLDQLPANTAPDFEFDYVDISSVTYDNGIINKETMLFSTAPSRARRIVRSGDIIFSTVRTYLKAIALIGEQEENVIASTGFAVYRSISSDQRFLFYAMQNHSFVSTIEAHSTGVSYPAIASSKISSFHIVFPDITEQRRIVSKLDAKCSQLDKVVEQTRVTIEEYKKLKQAIITEAVTKGVRGPRPMKPSGMEWIGDIPEEWVVLKTLWLLEMPITDGPHETPTLYDEGIPFISAEAVSCGRGRIDFSHKRGYISKEYYDECCKKYTPRLHDIYMIKSGATTGRVSMVDTEEVFTIWSPLAALRANQEKMLPRFLFYSLQADYYQKQISLSWSFGTQQNIGMRVLEQLKIATPAADEQQEIATYLDIKCAEIDRIIEKKEQLIEELGSYKKSLIYEYVTGKKEVTA